ncbi:N-acetylmuramoyl-L-alanine amidase [Tissierella sp. MSJ-40]|uniref:N-acetylmuramoyl-L-alanine amidase n=1 Tax=Tissierella simiarum TaxID=2841534 RepID=A0ABS6E902_9FIRM|nr:N-acetylmuramoyl-L-alanine amidase [Tissierella simiarum]MBU5439316.1 N-acetylmuramoyl-L-alanine amidase [Tissierella simiarum]
MVRILLAAGHGAGPAHNRGAIYFNEGDNNYIYSLELKKELETYENIKVDLLRKNITDDPTLADRAKAGQGYDLYLSIHSNATTNDDVRGTEVWDSVEKPNVTLAKLICDATAEVFNHRNRGVKYKEGQKGYNWYGELRFNQAKSAMIVENGFHTNKEDCLFFKDSHKKIAEIQARAIASYYSLKKKAIKEDKPHWAEEHYNNLKSRINITDKRFDDKITRGEAMALVDKALDYIEKGGK